LRRYGARVKTDGLAHDSGMRVLLACIARNAARHDRCIQPIMSIWDSHHLRVSMKVIKSVEISNKLEENLGWRISAPNKEEIQASIDAKLTPPSPMESLPMHCFLPLSYSVSRKDKRVSGPLWVGPIGNSEVMSSFTEEQAISMCTKKFEKDNLLSWVERDFELQKRKVLRSIRYIEQEAEVADCGNLILTDDLASWLNQGSPPSPNKMIELIKEKGFKAARSHYSKPSFRTDAPWDIIVECLNKSQPPI
jgi:tRNA (guanine26-N2/guanine27-N2)-dimethyltransferase